MAIVFSTFHQCISWRTDEARYSMEVNHSTRPHHTRRDVSNQTYLIKYREGFSHMQ